MFSGIGKRITYPNVVLTLALVFMMSGGAYAAGKYLITSTKQISPKVLKSLQGKAGANGATGPAGPTGSVGPAGPAGTGTTGPAGINGTNGTNGTDGTNGVSPASKKLEPGNANCEEGGSEFVAAESKKTYACNGSPWTAGGTLPSGKTETGVWSAAGMPYNAFDHVIENLLASVSFTIPLSEAAKSTVIGEGEKGKGNGCPITSEASKPEAEPGNLCVFVNANKNVASVTVKSIETGNEEAGKTGATIVLRVTTNEESAESDGTWAVTAK